MNMQKDQFGQQIGEQGRQFDVGMSQRESEFGRNFGAQQGQQDFQNMLGVGRFGMELSDFTNRNRMQDYNMQEGMLSHAPGGSFNPIDTQGAYNASMSGANNANNMAQSQYNAMIGGIGNIASAGLMPSALEFKIMNGSTTQARRDFIAARMLTMPIYDWDYKPQYREKGDKHRFGVLANDFNKHIIKDEDEQTIDVQRYIAALHVTVQELFYETRRLEMLLFHVADKQNIPMDAKATAKRKLGKVFDMADVIDENPQNWTPIGEG